jgi:NAD(P)-dependent dehydrogenase (short-subunit alcohol dehydrogenase family)
MKIKPLKGKVAVVAGGTRGAGRGIAAMLGEAGATVYVTGRSVSGNLSDMGMPETIEETAKMVSVGGGIGIPVRVDHTVEDEVKELFERVKREQAGRLDILVNDVWGGDMLTEWNKPFWEHSLQKGLLMQQRAVHSHMITSHYGVLLMVERGQGLVIEITDGTGYNYRESLYYSLAKISTIHLAEAMAGDFRRHNMNISAISLTPGFLRSELVLEHFGVTEENWKDGIKKDPHFAKSETPFYIGRAVVALASDPNVGEKSGKVLSSGGLAREYGFTDIDGTQPSWY